MIQHSTTDCKTGKVGYPTKQAAWNELDRIEARRQRAGGSKAVGWCRETKQNVFQCEFCHQFHIGRSLKDSVRGRKGFRK